MNYKNKLEQTKLDANPHKLEKKALLAESDDSDESDEEDPRLTSASSRNSYEVGRHGTRKRGLQKNQKGYRPEEEETKEQVYGQEQAQEFDDEFAYQSKMDYMDNRGKQIERVGKALGQVNKMYGILNDVIDQQGVTLHRI